MEFLMEYLIEEALIMIPVLYILAEHIIKPAELFDNRWIPLFLLAISLVMTPLVIGSFTASNVVQAVLVTGGAVLAHQVKKQTRKEE